VGALTIPNQRLSDVERRYRRIRQSLPKFKGEVKGRLLTESHVARVVDMLSRNNVLFEASAIDLGMHSEADIQRHKRIQEEGITKNITDDLHPEYRRGILDLRRSLEAIPLQLYVQSVVTFDVLDRLFEHATMYYSLREPRELGSFHWIIDGKNKGKITDWERWWSFCVMPMLESKSVRKPMIMITGGDYSHFERFSMAPVDKYPKIEYQPDANVTDLKKVFTESFRFSSDSDLGLEMVDVLTNAVRRALNGNLGFEGWRDIPKLMIRKRDHHHVRLISLADVPLRPRQVPYETVLAHFRTGGKSMLTDRMHRDNAAKRLKDRDNVQ
jgi:hypothetical protein